MDLVGYVLSLPAIVSWGCLTWVLGRPSIHITWPTLTYSSSLRGPYPQALTFLLEARFIAWGTPFSRMPTGPEVFLWMLGMSGLQFCTQTHLKKVLVLHSCVRWGSWQILFYSASQLLLLNTTVHLLSWFNNLYILYTQVL